MKEIFLGFFLTVVLTPFVIKLKILDIPSARKIHTNSIPKAGGLAIYLSLLFSAVSLGVASINSWFLLILGLITLLGLRDDIKEIKLGRNKLLIQIVIAIFALIMGFRFNLPNDFAAWIVSFIWITSYINSFNLIDGMDGLASGVGIVQLGSLLVLGPSMGVQSVFIQIGLVFLGAMIGFLIYNFNPAKIFLGDTGSLLMGLFIALFAIKVQVSSTGYWFNQIVGLGLITGYPIFDTVQTVLRRIKHRKPLMLADRSHTYNLLVDKYNLSTKQTVLLIYLICLEMGLVGQFIFQTKEIWLSLTALLLIMLLGLFSLSKGLGGYSQKEQNFDA